MDIIVKIQAPKQTRIFVLRPAYLLVISRSKPIAKPRSKDDNTLKNML